MKKQNYTLEKSANGWVFRSEDGGDTKEFKSTEGGLDVLVELLNSKAITLSSANDLLTKISDQEVLPVLDDENNQGLGQVIKSITIAESVQHIQSKLKWAILFENVEAPALVMCTCGEHGRIKIDNDHCTGDITSIPEGKEMLGLLIDQKRVTDDGAKKLLQQINDSGLTEIKDEEDEESFLNSFPLSGGVMVVSVRTGQKG